MARERIITKDSKLAVTLTVLTLCFVIFGYWRIKSGRAEDLVAVGSLLMCQFARMTESDLKEKLLLRLLVIALCGIPFMILDYLKLTNLSVIYSVTLYSVALLKTVHLLANARTDPPAIGMATEVTPDR